MRQVSRLAGLLLIAVTLSSCGGNSTTDNSNGANLPATATALIVASPTVAIPTVTVAPPTAIPPSPTSVPPAPTATAVAELPTATAIAEGETSTPETESAMATRETGERSAEGGKITPDDVTREDGYLTAAVSALKKTDYVAAKKYYAEFEACWKEFGDKVNDLSSDLHKEIETKMSAVSKELNAATPDASKAIAALNSLKQSNDKQNALLNNR